MVCASCHDNFVPDIAVIDPELALSCPPEITAASGMDTLTQLLESYVSPQATPLTDALAYSGMEEVKDNLVLASTTDGDKVEVRAGMAYAALMSGITLAHAGLGIVHGLASAVGGLFIIPHGVICGSLLGVATRSNIESLKKGDHPYRNGALEKYARVGALLSGSENEDRDECCELLIATLEKWTADLGVPHLGNYGVQMSDVDKIIAKTSNKDNPVELTRKDIKRLLVSRL